MAIPLGYKEVDIPPHIIAVFNQAFEEELQGCRLIVPSSEHTDAALWQALIEAREETIWNEDDSDDTDELFLNNRSKIRWH